MHHQAGCAGWFAGTQYLHWLQTRDSVPVIQDLRERGEYLKQAELDKAHKRLAKGEDPQAVMDALAIGLTNKFLHGSLHTLQHIQGAERDMLIKLLPELFRHNNSEK